jgi:Ca2+-binding RTX toxin-like protein
MKEVLRMRRRALLVVAMVALGVALVAGVAVAANITGTGAANTLTGTENADKISGGGGSDFIKGLAGPDKLWADFGAEDTLVGGTGDDLLVTLDQSGGDSVLAGEHPDDDDVCVVDLADDWSACETVVRYPPPPEM